MYFWFVALHSTHLVQRRQSTLSLRLAAKRGISMRSVRIAQALPQKRTGLVCPKKAKCETVETIPVPSCPVCGATGTLLYRGLRDALFGTQGLWTYRSCSTPCGTV